MTTLLKLTVNKTIGKNLHNLPNTGTEKCGRNRVCLRVCLRQEVVCTNHFLSFSLVANRVLLIWLDSNKTLKAVQVYARTTASGDGEIEKFYDEL